MKRITSLRELLLGGGSAVALTALTGMPANASDTAVLQAEIGAMKSAIKQLQRQVDQAQAQAAAVSAKAASAKGGAGGDDLDLKVKWKGAPELSSGDGKFKMKVRGRVQTEFNSIDQDEARTVRPDVN